jgi:hypothetical protein
MEIAFCSSKMQGRQATEQLSSQFPTLRKSHSFYKYLSLQTLLDSFYPFNFSNPCLIFGKHHN